MLIFLSHIQWSGAVQKANAIYARVSSRDQSHASQMPDLERWAAAQDGPVEWFTDSFTDRTMARPGMDKLIDAARSGKVARIVCWRLDRLGHIRLRGARSDWKHRW